MGKRIIFVLACSAFLALSVLAQQQPGTSDTDNAKKASEGLPIKAERTIEFETDEGTWLSLDVSQDGLTIVFDLLGDIYTLPIAGGEAKRIIAGISFESQPRFSPDGKRLAFLTDRSGAENVWIANADGTEPKAITKGRHNMYVSPSWTPDSQYVIVSRTPDRGAYSTWMYHVDGGAGVQIGRPDPPQPEPGSDEPARPRLNRMGIVASRDGRFFYYAQRTGNFNYNAVFPIWQLIRFDRETSETSTITNAQGSAMRPLLTPDGKHLVYATRFETNTGLRVRDLETGEERWLIHPVTRDDQESRGTRDVMPGYAFMPDGKSLIVPLMGKIQRVDFETGRATPIPFRARVEAEIGPRVYTQVRVEDTPTVRSRLIRWPSLSPDGRRVVFSALNKLWIADVPGGRPRRLTSSTAGEFMPAWARDGRSIVYVTWTSNGGHIQTVSPEGGNPVQLTRRPAFYSDPVYSPDGQRIVFQSGTTGDQLYSDLREMHTDVEPDASIGEIGGVPKSGILDLRWIPASGGDSTLIGAAQGGRSPHFANDPNRVYMTANGGLMSIRIDGYDRRTYFRVTGTGPGPNPPSADLIAISPDEQRALVSIQNKHYILNVPKAGRETVRISLSSQDSSSVPVKKMSAEGGDYVAWSANDSVTWSLGSRFYRQALNAEQPQMDDLAVEAPRARPEGTVVLRGARVISMKGAEVIERGDVVITGNRIVAVGPTGGVQAPAQARIIDVSGKTIIPGFVDVHAHMWAPRGVHQTQVWQYLANMAYGVTTTRDPQTSTSDVFAYSDMVETGEILGPRVFATGPGVFSTSGLDDLDATRNFLKRYRDAYRTNTIKAYVSGDRIVRQWVAIASKELGLTITTEGGLDMKLDLSQMADGMSIEHSLPIQPLYKDVAMFTARAGIYYTPTILVAYGAPWTENHFFETTDVHGNEKLRRFIPHELLDSMVRRRRQWFMPEEYGHQGIARGAADIVKAGGRVGVGSHGQMQGLGYHWELWAIQSGGMSNFDALRVATIFGAEAIGLQQDVGSLEAGKMADLIVMDRNPLDDIRNTNTIRYVMKNGEMFEGSTLDRVWPGPKPLGRQYWWDYDPKPVR